MRRTSPISRAIVTVAACLAVTVLVSARQAPAPRAAFPARGAWPKAEPAAVGLDKAKLADAIAFAVANQNRDTRDLAVAIPNAFRSEAPYNALIGPTAPRAESNGIIIRHGKVAAEWGDTARADMTFSVTKTFSRPSSGSRSTAERSRASQTASPAMCRKGSTSSPHLTTRRLRGSTCCGRRATGPGRYGANPTGPTVRRAARHRTNGKSARCTSRARSSSTTTRGSTCSRSRRSTSSSNRCPKF